MLWADAAPDARWAVLDVVEAGADVSHVAAAPATVVVGDADDSPATAHCCCLRRLKSVPVLACWPPTASRFRSLAKIWPVDDWAMSCS